MKKVILTIMVLAFAVTMVTAVGAADLPKQAEKLTKGAVDIVQSPLAIYDHTKAEYDRHDTKSVGLLKGLLESPFAVIKKAGSGAIDVATFPVE